MKKIFAGIGILVALFTIFFFLLVADKMVYQNNEKIYDFSLSKSISVQDLTTFAKNIDVTIRLVNFKNTSFGKNELDVTFINPDSSIRLGRKPSVFPKEKIVYQIFNENTKKKITYFTIQNNDYIKIKKMKSLLERNGFDTSIDHDEPINFSIGMLFSSLNIGFFALLTILLILSIATYYVYRLKEVGVLKINGWANGKISFRLLIGLLIHLYLFSLLCILPFGIYVIFSDVNKIRLYARVYFLVSLFLAVVFIMSAFVGTFFIHNVNQIGAIKNKKNNRLIFFSLLIFKIVITVFFVLSVNKSFNNLYRLDSTVQSINELVKYDFYKIHTSVTPEDAIQTKLNRLINSFDDENLFNYDPLVQSIDKRELKKYQSSGKLRSADECSYSSISANILELLDIRDVEGNTVKACQIDVKGNTLLVPIHYKDDIKKVLNNYQLGKDTKIIYIQNGQVQADILCPGYYLYDSVYYIHELRKGLYINGGEVLLKKQSAEILEHALMSLGLDKGSIGVESLNKDYNIYKANAQLDLYESLFRTVITTIAFLLCIFSIATIFLELRKKEFGVYKLIGKYPLKAIAKFVGLNWIITILTAIVVNRVFLLLLIIEGTMYGVMIYKYIRNKAILALKGE